MRQDPFCSAGIDFLIIESDGSYYRCYSERLIPGMKPIGNIANEDRFNLIRPNLSRCPYRMECAQGDRISCDFGATIRYEDDASNPNLGHSYLFDPPATYDRMGENSCLQIFWHISRLCNFACVYCNEPHSSKNDTVGPSDCQPEMLVNIVDKMAAQFKRVRINLTGGECTRHPAFLDICTAINLRQDVFELKILSNMSCSEKLIDVCALHWKPGHLAFWSSAHFSDPRFDLDGFTEACIAASAHGPISVSFVDHPHERAWYPLYALAMREMGLKAEFWHMYYESNRARTKGIAENFRPKSLGRVCDVLGLSSDEQILAVIDRELRLGSVRKVGM